MMRFGGVLRANSFAGMLALRPTRRRGRWRSQGGEFGQDGGGKLVFPDRPYFVRGPDGFTALIKSEEARHAGGPAPKRCHARIRWVHKIFSRKVRRESISARTALSPAS